MVSFSLVAAQSGVVLVDNIENGSEIDISSFDTTILSVRANAVGSPGSVIFDLNGKTDFQTENVDPYALAGNRNDGSYKKWAYDLRVENNVTATPYPLRAGGGTAGVPLQILFTIVD